MKVHKKRQVQTDQSIDVRHNKKLGSKAKGKKKTLIFYRSFGEFNGKYYAEIEYKNKFYFVQVGHFVDEFLVTKITKKNVSLKYQEEVILIDLLIQK